MAGETATLQVLDLLRRELRAANVYLEFGGTPRLEPTVVSQPLDEHWRVVAVFAEPPPGDTRERLSALLAAFANHRPSLTPVARTLGRPPAERRLDQELLRLQELLGAKVSLIIDESSPVLWGATALRSHGVDVDYLLELAAAVGRLGEHNTSAELLALAQELGATPTEGEALGGTTAGTTSGTTAPVKPELEKLRAASPPFHATEWYISLLAALTVAVFRGGKQKDFRGRRVAQPPPIGYVAQNLASQYLLLFVFDEPFSQLHAEATAVHAVPPLEKLIAELPPIDPSGGATAVRRPKLKLV